MEVRTIAPLVCLSLLLVPASKTAGAQMARDSAGVAIVENPIPRWPAGLEWRVDSVPSVVIGEGNDPLYQVRGPRRLSDGRIVFANRGSLELRFYDAGGGFLTASGGEGEGPGEFASMLTPGPLVMPRDSIAAWDPGLHRVSVFDSDGTYVRTFRLESRPFGLSGPFLEGVFADGSFVGRAIRVIPDSSEVPGYQAWHVLRFSADGATQKDFGAFRTSAFGRNGPCCRTHVFGPRGAFAVHGNALYYGFGDTYEVQMYDTEGALHRIIRKPHESLPIPRSYFESYKKMILDGFADQRAQWESYFATLEVPEVMPAFDTIIVDDAGNLWVEEHTEVRPTDALTPPQGAPPGQRTDADPRWSVFDAEGKWLGMVKLPPRFEPTHIGADFLLGVYRDEFDVETVRIYGLIKS